jgi:hypothetical protein
MEKIKFDQGISAY